MLASYRGDVWNTYSTLCFCAVQTVTCQILCSLYLWYNNTRWLTLLLTTFSQETMKANTNTRCHMLGCCMWLPGLVLFWVVFSSFFSTLLTGLCSGVFRGFKVFAYWSKSKGPICKCLMFWSLNMADVVPAKMTFYVFFFCPFNCWPEKIQAWMLYKIMSLLF